MFENVLSLEELNQEKNKALRDACGDITQIQMINQSYMTVKKILSQNNLSDLNFKQSVDLEPINIDVDVQLDPNLVGATYDKASNRLVITYPQVTTAIKETNLATISDTTNTFTFILGNPIKFFIK